MPSRRDFLKGVAGATVLGGIAGMGSAAKYSEQPDHVTLLGYANAKADIETYRPLFTTQYLKVKPHTLYAWKAVSSEFDTDMYCYWAYYVVQDAYTEQASHLPDREPFYVEVDPDSGDVLAVHYDTYHYLRRTDPGPVLVDSTHARYRIVKPWHPYQPTTEEGVFVDLGDLHDQYQPWIDNGWKVYRPAVVNPWTMKTRGHWWPEGTFGIEAVDEISRAFLNLRQRTGLDIPLPGRET